MKRIPFRSKPPDRTKPRKVEPSHFCGLLTVGGQGRACHCLCQQRGTETVQCCQCKEPFEVKNGAAYTMSIDPRTMELLTVRRWVNHPPPEGAE